MIRLLIFIVATFFFLRISWRALKNRRTHGFYRFFVFEIILVLVLLNHPYWLLDPFTPLHLLSWTLLLVSIIFIFQSIKMLRTKGGYGERSTMPENFTFENTSRIVEEGIYRYIRHPMYSSLLFLAWGAFFKHVSLLTIILVLTASGLLIATARVEERENILHFGKDYEEYRKRTKMFIPWLF
ncbi:MAG: isoprenylcysteine carboxylmethyltransferase family protein [Desulfocapsaceae bacterium]|nr:isoprenylcysteine carboxylmethyltransferase family protein [Desulfocapsaceae bacterium]